MCTKNRTITPSFDDVMQAEPYNYIYFLEYSYIYAFAVTVVN